MVQNFWWIVLSAGVADAVNPSIFVLAAFVLLIARLKQSRSLWLQLVLILSAIASTACINLGLDVIWFNDTRVVMVIKIIEGLLVLLMVKLGYDGVISWQQHYQESPKVRKDKGSFIQRLLAIPVINVILICLCGGFMGIIISQWPTDMYLNVLVNSMMVSGDIWQLFFLWVIYIIMSCWPVFLLLVLSRLNILSKASKELLFAGASITASCVGLLIFK